MASLGSFTATFTLEPETPKAKVRRLEVEIDQYREYKSANETANRRYERTIADLESELAQARAELEKSKYPRYFGKGGAGWEDTAYFCATSPTEGYWVAPDGKESPSCFGGREFINNPAEREISETEAKALVKPKTVGQEIAENRTCLGSDANRLHVGRAHFYLEVFEDGQEVLRAVRANVASIIDDALAKNEKEVKERVKAVFMYTDNKVFSGKDVHRYVDSI